MGAMLQLAAAVDVASFNHAANLLALAQAAADGHVTVLLTEVTDREVRDHIVRRVTKSLEGRDEKCQRCSTRIKNVWVMEKQTEPKETQRIGSCCGPKLEELS